MTEHTHSETAAVANPAEAREANPARAYRQRGRAAAKRRQRTRAAMRSETRTLAFAGSEDAHTLAQNPNRAKRHTAPASQRDPRTADRKRTEPRKLLVTTFRGLPSYPPFRTKNIVRGVRGVITEGDS